jgi:hypothetical protein
VVLAAVVCWQQVTGPSVVTEIPESLAHRAGGLTRY